MIGSTTSLLYWVKVFKRGIAGKNGSMVFDIKFRVLL